MNTYEKWLNSEKEWIGAYCKKTIRSSVLKVIPATLILLTVLFALLVLVNGNASSEEIIGGAAGGFFIGAIVSIFYLLFLLPGLSPKRYVKKIEKALKKCGLNDSEKEQLAQELLEAEADKEKTITFEMVGPKSNHTPARFVITPHYALLEGGYPYAIFIRLSDIARIEAAEEEKTTTTRSGNMKNYYRYTLYTIGFFRKDRAERGLSDNELPDEAMGFFDAEIRDHAMRLLGQ